MKINKALNLIQNGQPAYYISTNEMTYENGMELARTWADYVRVDFEHGPLNLPGLKMFMQGLVDTRKSLSLHDAPAVIAELPFPGHTKEIVKANGWIARQILACGVHGLILCHAESAAAIEQLIQEIRYPLNETVQNTEKQGLRGHGGEKFAAEVWNVTPSEYIALADLYPLNNNGQLILGVKMENPRAANACEKITAINGIFFGEWGLGDMSLCFGFKDRPEFPLPQELEEIRLKIWNSCLKNGVHFLGIATVDTIENNIKNGMMMIRCYDMNAVKKGKTFTKRE